MPTTLDQRTRVVCDHRHRDDSAAVRAAARILGQRQLTDVERAVHALGTLTGTHR